MKKGKIIDFHINCVTREYGATYENHKGKRYSKPVYKNSLGYLLKFPSRERYLTDEESASPKYAFSTIDYPEKLPEEKAGHFDMVFVGKFEGGRECV